MNPGRIIHAHSHDRGAVAPLHCSQCNCRRWFHLFEHDVSILSIEPSRSSVFAVHCSQCDYATNLSSKDAQRAMAFLQTTQEFLVHRIDEGEYFRALHAAQLEFVKENRNLNTNWKCAQCGEESPLTFASCWNCQMERPNVTPSAPSEGLPKTPHLDRVMGSEDNGPFSTMQF